MSRLHLLADEQRALAEHLIFSGQAQEVTARPINGERYVELRSPDRLKVWMFAHRPDERTVGYSIRATGGVEVIKVDGDGNTFLAPFDREVEVDVERDTGGQRPVDEDVESDALQIDEAALVAPAFTRQQHRDGLHAPEPSTGEAS